MSAIALRDVSLSYGQGENAHLVLSGINLSVKPGEFLSVVGPSGCGKTTLLRVVAGLVQPSSGSVESFNAPITRPSRDRAIVFQDYAKALLPWRKVWANVALPLENASMGQRERRDEALKLLSVMRLQRIADHFPDQLSGGMQQRVQIARTLTQKPRVWLMDEPFGALDAITRQQLQDEVSAMASERGMAVIFITHDLEEAIYLGDRVVVLGAHPGRVLEDLTVDLSRPRDQLATKEHPRFLELRHHLFGLLQEH